MDTKYELFYFNSKGRAEAVRLIFAQAGVKYVDTRFENRDDWLANYKSKSPFGVAPFLEVDGVQIGGGLVIARYLGEAFGLAGSNAIENAQLGSIADQCEDMLAEAVKGIEAKDDEEKARLKEEFKNKSSKWLTTLEGKIDDSGWFCNKLTWVDCHVAFFLSLVTELGGYGDGLLKDYPKLSALVANVNAQPNIAKWIKERPVTPH